MRPFLIVVACSLFSTGRCSAGDVTYQFLPITNLVSSEDLLETDGELGVLSSSDVLSCTCSFDFGASQEIPVSVSFAGLVATQSELTLSSPGYIEMFSAPGYFEQYGVPETVAIDDEYGYLSPLAPTSLSLDGFEVVYAGTSNGQDFAAEDMGNPPNPLVIAQAIVVPEPSTGTLLLFTIVVVSILPYTHSSLGIKAWGTRLCFGRGRGASPKKVSFYQVDD